MLTRKDSFSPAISWSDQAFVVSLICEKGDPFLLGPYFPLVNRESSYITNEVALYADVRHIHSFLCYARDPKLAWCDLFASSVSLPSLLQPACLYAVNPRIQLLKRLRQTLRKNQTVPSLSSFGDGGNKA